MKNKNMKTLSKIQFIPFLKTISDILDKEEIEHEIPFCHIDKILFNNITIIIPDHIAIFDINRMFATEYIKEKEGIITCIIDGILIDFVKTKSEEWFYTFYYYSWDMLHVFIDILYGETFNLRYTRNGLKYQFDEKKIDMTNNMKDILDFIELPFHMINNGFPTDYVMFEFIESSPYYSTEYFTMENFEKYDENFNFNKQYYENFIKHKPDIISEKMDLDEQILFIDSNFYDSKFLEKLSKYQIKKEFPNLKEKDIIIKDLEELKNDKKQQINKRKKIKFNKSLDEDSTFENL